MKFSDRYWYWIYLSIVVYGVLTSVIFLRFRDQLARGLQAICRFTPETPFPSGPACSYSHLLISWIFGTSVQLLHVFLTHLV